MERDLFKGLEIVKVIKITLLRGDGTKDSPYRKVERYCDLDGNLLVEIDPLKKEYL